MLRPVRITIIRHSLPLNIDVTMLLAVARDLLGHREQARALLAKGNELEEQIPRLESGNLTVLDEFLELR